MKVLLLVVLTLFLFACSSDNSHDSSVKDELLKQVEKTSALVVKNTNEVVQKVKVVSNKVVKQVKESSTKVVSMVTKKTNTISSYDGKSLFKKCAGCHGIHADKKALGKSQVIRGWDVERILIALSGYKDGSYGSSMKGVMKSQVSKLSDIQMEKLAEYISKQ